MSEPGVVPDEGAYTESEAEVLLEVLGEALTDIEETRDGYLNDGLEWRANPPACLLFVILMVATFESSLKLICRKDNRRARILKHFFDEKAPNTKRVESFRRALALFGEKLDEDTIQDFLAIQKLRNFIVHGPDPKRAEEARQTITQRGFPTNVNEFTSEHWYRLVQVHNDLSAYLIIMGIGASRLFYKDGLQLD